MKRWRGWWMAVALLVGLAGVGMVSEAQTASKPAGVLGREEAAKILPSSVFYAGQSATVQGRNSAGIRTADGKLVLVSLVDTSGYSTGVAERYQAYLITEVPLAIGTGSLPPGAYGFGFIKGDRLVVMDLGTNELLNTASTRDDAMKRPSPLQIVAGPAGGYRLYLGRNYVTIATKAGR